MSERRFVIDKVENYHSMAPINIVTESELKRRLVEIATYMHSEEGMWPRGIRTLLHGEGKEEPCPYCKLVHKDTDTCMGYPEQPDPWEVWVEEMPHFSTDDVDVPAMFLIEWRRDLKHWIKKMPRGK